MRRSAAKFMPARRPSRSSWRQISKPAQKSDDGLLAGINFDADRRITEIYLVSATVAPPDDRMRHFCATPVTELPSRRLRDVVSFPKIQLTAREVKKKRDHPMR